MSRQFTVIGYWDDADQRVVTGVIEGEHEVTGGDGCSDGGPFAVYIHDAIDAPSAESMVNGTDTGKEFD